MAKTMDFTSEHGNKYTFQKVPPSKWLGILDKSDATGVRNRVVFYGEVLEHVVAIPGGLKIDDFDADDRGGIAELDEVVLAAGRFQSGK
jgi:hypothetical protein